MKWTIELNRTPFLLISMIFFWIFMGILALLYFILSELSLNLLGNISACLTFGGMGLLVCYISCEAFLEFIGRSS